MICAALMCGACYADSSALAPGQSGNPSEPGVTHPNDKAVAADGKRKTLTSAASASTTRHSASGAAAPGALNENPAGVQDNSQGSGREAAATPGIWSPASAADVAVAKPRSASGGCGSQSAANKPSIEPFRPARAGILAVGSGPPFGNTHNHGPVPTVLGGPANVNRSMTASINGTAMRHKP